MYLKYPPIRADSCRTAAVWRRIGITVVFKCSVGSVKMSGKFSPAMKAVIAESARKVFGNRPVVPYRTGFKHLARRPVAPIATNHYVEDMTRNFKAVAKDYTSEIEERRTEALGRLRRRGKGPPKKGQGKRASRKK